MLTQSRRLQRAVDRFDSETKPSPYAIGRVTTRWYLFFGVLLALVAQGVYAYSLQYSEGEIVTGMRDIGTMGGAAWGLYIAFVVYFVGVSFAGITMAALTRIFDLKVLRPVSRPAELLTVISLVLAAFSILADVGQPLRAIVNLFTYARPQSPFFGTFTLVISGYLFASLVYLYLGGRRDAALCMPGGGPLRFLYRLWAAGYRDTPAERRRHARISLLLALAIIPLLVTAHSTLGFVFGIQGGRPGWFSTLQAPGFVMMAGVSGVGLLIVIAALLRLVLGERERLGPEVFKWLGGFLMGLTAAYLYFMVAEWLTTSYASPAPESEVGAAVQWGPYALLYWASVALLAVTFILLALQFALSRLSLPLMVLCGVLANLAAVGKRVLVVIPSQTHGTLLPYSPGSYTPTWVEYSVILGLFALGILAYALFMKLFPIMEVAAPTGGGK